MKSINEEADDSILSHKVSFRLNQIDIDIDKQPHQEVNNVINKLQSENSRQIGQQEHLQDKMLELSTADNIFKIEYLSCNYSEEWLRLAFPQHLSHKLRCASEVQTYNVYGSREYSGLAPADRVLEQAEMLLEDPFLFQELKQQRNAAKEDWKAVKGKWDKPADKQAKEQTRLNKLMDKQEAEVTEQQIQMQRLNAQIDKDQVKQGED